MAYQVLARKYRPKAFDDVVGQPGVTQTLRNALKFDRLAQSFVFAGPRGVGKTTTARILARSLNCVNGPTPDPCGVCDACCEIAEGRDIDVLEIDAATHTQVENIREVIISGLTVSPIRNRYKVFIIDEVHQLSSHSFNALLKSIEEPPAHVVFMMATTRLDKIPDTILSRSQVYEFRAIGRQTIAEKLAAIANSESIAIDREALVLLARAADGSMRDAQSAFDQVIAFAGDSIGTDDVSAALGLIGRDTVLDVVEAVANETQSAVFELAGKFVDAGYDLKLVCRELSRAIRDLLVIAIDPSRTDDPEISSEGEDERLASLAMRFSREDLLRAFDVLARAEYEIQRSAQPRYHFEMALLRLIHVRKLVPLVDLLSGRSDSTELTASGHSKNQNLRKNRQNSSERLSQKLRSRPPTEHKKSARVLGSTEANAESVNLGAVEAPCLTAEARPSTGHKKSTRASGSAEANAAIGNLGVAEPPSLTAEDRSSRKFEPNSRVSGVDEGDSASGDLKAAILSGIKREKKFFYGTVVAQAQRIEFQDDQLVFTFTKAQRALSRQLLQLRLWLEETSARVVGRKVVVVAKDEEIAVRPQQTPEVVTDPLVASASRVGEDETDQLRARAMGDSLVKAMLDVFPSEIEEVEEM